MHITRPPMPALRPFVKQLWASRPQPGLLATGPEKVLPTGHMHLVFRLEAPLILLAPGTGRYQQTIAAQQGIIGGIRDGFYLRETGAISRSVGAMLQPGVASVLFGASAQELAQRHTRLSDLWGPLAFEIHDQLSVLSQPAQQIDCLEAYLLQQIPPDYECWQPLATALRQLEQGQRVDNIVKASGFSHRYFNQHFVSLVGLSPKRYSRVRRFSQLLGLARESTPTARPWSEIALDFGFSDQAHLAREFQTFAGLSPGDYRQLAPVLPHHLPLRSR